MPGKVLLAAAFLILAMLAGCASVTKPWIAPEVALSGLRVKELGLARQSFIVTLDIRNPNDRALPLSAMTYRLSLEGTEFATGGGVLERQIPAFGEETVDVEVVSELFGLLQRLPALAMKGEPLAWRIAGTATLTGGLVTLPYWYSGEIDPRQLIAATPR